MGKLAIIFGARRIFLTGFVILLLAGFVGAAAPTFGVLLLSRALIGTGSAAAYPTAMMLIRKRSDDLNTGVPNRVLAGLSIASQVTMVIGLPLGGVLTGSFGWRAILFVNVPLALIASLLTPWGVPKDPSTTRSRPTPVVTALDLTGIALFAGTIATLLMFLSDLADPSWWLLVGALTLGAVLICWERRAAHPLIDVLALGRNRQLLGTYLRQTVVSLANYTALYGVSQWLEGAAHYTASQVGLLLLPLSVVSILAAWLVSGRGWVRWPLILTGAVLLAAGAVMLVVTHSSSVAVLIAMTLLLGVANGFSGYANQAALYVQAPAEEMGAASGLYRTFAYLGAIFSASLIGLAFGAHATDHGLHLVAYVIAGIGASVLLLTVLDHTLPGHTDVNRETT